MNAMPTPPSSDNGGWFSFAEHLEAAIGVALGAVMTAAAGLWRAATWTAQIKEDREASDERHKSILDKLDDMHKSNAQQHESARREIDQVRQDIRADREETRAMRQETREAAATLSARIDFVMSDRRH